MTCEFFEGRDRVHVIDRKDFSDDVCSSIESTMKLLKQHLMLKYEFDGQPRRIEVPETVVEPHAVEDTPGFGAKFGAKFGARFGASGERAHRLAQILGRIAEGTMTGARTAAGDFGVSSRTIEKDIRRLRGAGLIAHEGHAQWGRYILTEKGMQVLRELMGN